MTDEPVKKKVAKKAPTKKYKNIFERIHAVMEGLQYLQKGDKHAQGWTYVSHDRVAEAIRPHLLEHGIVVRPTIVDHDLQTGSKLLSVVTLKVEFICIDKPDDKTDIITVGYGLNTQDKGIGAAISYAFKYALLKMLCLPTGDDADSNDVDFEPRNEGRPTPKPPAKQKASDARSKGFADLKAYTGMTTKDGVNLLKGAADAILLTTGVTRADKDADLSDSDWRNVSIAIAGLKESGIVFDGIKEKA